MSSAHPIKANWQNQLAQRGSTVTLTPPAAQPLKPAVALSLFYLRGGVPLD